MIYLFWLIVLAVAYWALRKFVPMEGTPSQLVTIGFVIVGLVLLYGLFVSIVPAFPAFPIK